MPADPRQLPLTPAQLPAIRLAPVVRLSDHRLPPRPRVQATTSGSVILLVGTGEHEREEWLDLAGARALLDELADAVDAAEFLARVSREVTGV